VEYAQGGYEVVDKLTARGAFLDGAAGSRFAQSMKDAVAEDASDEHLDEFLDTLNDLLNLPVVYH
jgi:hypothetical protein